MRSQEEKVMPYSLELFKHAVASTYMVNGVAIVQLDFQKKVKQISIFRD